MTIPQAIPTMYKGTRFRSRLEACWAAFFDLVGWRWEYEPFDLPGWIPDFALVGADEITLVEVKPVAGLDDPIAHGACAKAGLATRNRDRDNEILLLGYVWPTTIIGGTGIGWLGERSWSGNGHLWWEPAPFHDLGGLGFHHDFGSFRNRITGQYEGDQGAGAEAPIDEWHQAGNAVRWRP